MAGNAGRHAVVGAGPTGSAAVLAEPPNPSAARQRRTPDRPAREPRRTPDASPTPHPYALGGAPNIRQKHGRSFCPH